MLWHLDDIFYDNYTCCAFKYRFNDVLMWLRSILKERFGIAPESFESHENSVNFNVGYLSEFLLNQHVRHGVGKLRIHTFQKSQKILLVLNPLWSLLWLRTGAIFERYKSLLPQIHHIWSANEVECLWKFNFCKIQTFTFPTPFQPLNLD